MISHHQEVTSLQSTVEAVSLVTCQPDPDTRKHTSSRAYKAIHYERQSQLPLKHVFDLTPVLESVRTWVHEAPSHRPDDIVTLRLVFSLPDRRKTKNETQSFDLGSMKEYEAAQTGLLYARSLIDILVDDQYTFHGYAFKTGLQLGPSWREEDTTKTCAVLEFPCSSGRITPDVLAFAVRILFSTEEINYMQAGTIGLYFNDCILGAEELPTTVHPPPVDAATTFYSVPQVQDILLNAISGRNVLFTLKTSRGSMRQGMMVKTLSGWQNVVITSGEDLFRSVVDHGITEFIPAVNRAEEDYPSIITIETDPGSMMEVVLGKKKSWILNTYITEKILAILERYNLYYSVKFSGNKGWHIQLPVELETPFNVYQEVVEAIVNKDVDALPTEEQINAAMANILQLEDVKSYKDPFFVARRFVDLVGARVMFYELKDIHTVLTLHDLKTLLLRTAPMRREDYLLKNLDIYETPRGPVKVEVPQLLSINPYSRFRRQFKLLIDHSSNKKEGKLRSVFSLHSKTGLVSLPALLNSHDKTRFDPRMWDYDFVRVWARAERVYNKVLTDTRLVESVHPMNVNEESKFEQFLKDNRGLLIYLLQNGGEALELLTTPSALWVNAHLWEKTVTQ
jgi:DNA primase